MASSFYFSLSNHEEKPIIFSANEDLWRAILSQDEEKVKGMVKILGQEAVKYVICHLRKMVSEEGWHPAQQTSASFALQVIKLKSSVRNGHLYTNKIYYN